MWKQGLIYVISEIAEGW
jgi:hypothetical protein